jgi:hypothetical protein
MKVNELIKGETYFEDMGRFKQPYRFTGKFEETFFGPNCSEYCPQFEVISALDGEVMWKTNMAQSKVSRLTK